MCPPNDKEFLKDLVYFQTFGNGVRRTDIAPVYVIYDQEPLLDYALNTYNYRLRSVTRKHLHPIIDQLEFGEMFACWLFVATFPICCHSEKNSAEIASLEKHLGISCYYWYHAFTARDWYRLWERHKDLMPTNKSQAAKRFLIYARDRSGTREYRKLLLDQLHDLKDTILYDWDGARVVPASYSATIDVADANLSGIHLVAETLFRTEKIQLTEKVFKPMVMSQPFLIWAAPGTLAYLRDYGFKTFDGIWSEAYDREPDADRRMKMLVDLTHDLADLSQDQYHELYEKCLPIIQHNRQRFFSARFMDDCWQELETNWRTACQTRSELTHALPGGQFLNVLYRKPDLRRLPFYQGQIESIIDRFDPVMRDRIGSKLIGLSDF